MKTIFPVTGMSCTACANSIETLLKATKGIKEVKINYATTTLSLDFDDTIISIPAIKTTVQSLGYDIITETNDTQNIYDIAESESDKSLLKIKYKVIWSGIFSIPLFVLAMFFMDLKYSHYIQWLLATPVLFIFGSGFFIRAWKNLKHRTSNMDTLVALSTGSAYLFSVFNTLNPNFWHQRGIHPHIYFEASAIVIFFILTGKYLEEKVKKGTSEAIRKLSGLQVKTAHVKTENSFEERAVEEIKPGMILLVKPGEKIPADGEVTAGESYIDESSMTGEPVPEFKKTGSKVLAGTLNQLGSFEFKAVRSGSETRLAGIIQSVRNAMSGKAPTEKLADKISAIFVPTVIIVALFTFLLWYFLGGINGFGQGIISMVTVLVIACPCALGLATPAAITTGIGRGATNGILIRDPEALEKAAKIDTLILDKTGTITEGKPSVKKIFWNTGEENAVNHAILAGLAGKSEHPLSQAIAATVTHTELSEQKIYDFKSVTGLGTQCFAGKGKYFLGSLKFMVELNIDQTGIPNPEAAETIVYFFNESHWLACISIVDPIKENMPETIDRLKSRGFEIFILSGDREETTEQIATSIGVTGFKGAMMPGEKAAFIRDLQSKGKIVGMAGDGINDSEALAVADVSFAMAQGSDISMDVAGITLANSHPSMILKAIDLSHSTVKIMKQNLFWAFIYNIVGIPVAAGLLFPFTGYLLNPMLAGAMMALSSISVISNSLRLRSIPLGV